MNKPFNPKQPEEKVTLEVTAREANLIKELRSSTPYGKFVVHKTEGFIVRVELHDNSIIEDHWDGWSK